MHYFIDGYNLLFRITKNYKTLKQKQKEIVAAINTWAIDFKLDITIVFDGREKDPPIAVRGHLDQLEIIYTPEHQTADSYILKEIENSPHPRQETVISSDRELIGKAKQQGAHIQTVEEFLSFLVKKQQKHRHKPHSSPKKFSDSTANIERLCRIFEAKLQNNDDVSNLQ